jgi:hypothetical protein
MSIAIVQLPLPPQRLTEMIANPDSHGQTNLRAAQRISPK